MPDDITLYVIIIPLFLILAINLIVLAYMEFRWHLPRFYVWYRNTIMVRPKFARTRLAQKLSKRMESRLSAEGKIEEMNIFEIFGYLWKEDGSHTKVFFREVDSILDRHMMELCTTAYAVARINEVYNQFLDYKNSQESQGL